MSSATADLWMTAPCRQGVVQTFLWIPSNLYCSDALEMLIHSCFTCYVSVSMERPDGRKKPSLKENMPSVYLMSTLERGHHTRESELAPRGSQSKNQEACKSLRLKPWFPAHSPTKPSSPGPQDHLLSNPPGWTPQRFPTSWSARDLSSVFFLRSLFSLARWHTSAPKPTFLALSLQRHNIETLFKYLPQSMK